MSSEIIAVLDDLAKRFGIVINWSSENVLPYVQALIKKLVNYEIATSILWIMVGLIIAGVSLSFTYAAYRKYRSTDDEDYLLVSWIPLMGVFIGAVVVIYQTHDIIKCMTIPELIVLKYVKQLSSGG